jgi:hypothetical protein
VNLHGVAFESFDQWSNVSFEVILGLRNFVAPGVKGNFHQVVGLALLPRILDVFGAQLLDFFNFPGNFVDLVPKLEHQSPKLGIFARNLVDSV